MIKNYTLFYLCVLFATYSQASLPSQGQHSQNQGKDSVVIVVSGENSPLVAGAVQPRLYGNQTQQDEQLQGGAAAPFVGGILKATVAKGVIATGVLLWICSQLCGDTNEHTD